jgi:hypothetical protein
METCPYCAEEQHALKNHVRLTSGDGHGPSGTYPDDFEDGNSANPDTAGQETDATPNSRNVAPDADVPPSDRDDGQPAAVESAPADSTVDGDTNDDTDTDPSDSPVFGSVDPDADPDPDTSDEVKLPCGCESYDESEAPDEPFFVTCSTCGTSYRVTPDGDESETDDDRVKLPCGCESFDPAEAPEPPFKMTCTDCGEPYKVKA